MLSAAGIAERRMSLLQRRKAIEVQYAAAKKLVDSDEALLEQEIADESEMRLAVGQLAALKEKMMMRARRPASSAASHPEELLAAQGKAGAPARELSLVEVQPKAAVEEPQARPSVGMEVEKGGSDKDQSAGAKSMPVCTSVGGGEGQSCPGAELMPKCVKDEDQSCSDSENEGSDRDENQSCSGSDASSHVCAGEMVDESMLGDGRYDDSSGEENMLGGIFDE
jgi:hypothetical protein